MAAADRFKIAPPPPLNRAVDDRGRLILRTSEQIRERNAEAIRALDEVAGMGDEDEQAATLAFLGEALGPGRVISDRPLFPKE